MSSTEFARVEQQLGEMPREDGWLDGDGVATTPQATFTMRLTASALVHAGVLVNAHVYPRPCGGCQVEWEVGAVGCELRVLSVGDVCEWFVYDQRGTQRGNSRFEEECLSFDPRDAAAMSEAIAKAAEFIRVYR